VRVFDEACVGVQLTETANTVMRLMYARTCGGRRRRSRPVVDRHRLANGGAVVTPIGIAVEVEGDIPDGPAGRRVGLTRVGELPCECIILRAAGGEGWRSECLAWVVYALYGACVRVTVGCRF
jgi:hypothetical protein